MKKEDFESLGWKITKVYDSDEYDAQKIISAFKFFDLHYDEFLNELQVEEFYQTSLVAIPTHEYNSITVFKGIIATIEDFKILMRFLEINT